MLMLQPSVSTWCPCIGCRLGSSHFRVLPQCGYPPIRPDLPRRPAHTHSFSVRSVGKVIALATLPSTRSFLEFVLHEQHVVRMHKLSKMRVHLMDRYPWALWLKVPVALSSTYPFISFAYLLSFFVFVFVFLVLAPPAAAVFAAGAFRFSLPG